MTLNNSRLPADISLLFQTKTEQRYGKDELDKEDAVLRSDENAGQRAALLEAARAEAADMQAR